MAFLLYLYLIGMVSVWIVSGYLHGKANQQVRFVNRNQPGVVIDSIMTNPYTLFVWGLVWPSFYANLYGEKVQNETNLRKVAEAQKLVATGTPIITQNPTKGGKN